MAYEKPAPADLRLRYPEFGDVLDDRVAYWLTDAQRIVTEAWGPDEAPAMMALAAHNMVGAGLGGGGKVAELARKGVTSFKSASMSVQLDGSAVAASVGGGYSSTRYGQEFATMLRRNRSGPFLARTAGYVR